MVQTVTNNRYNTELIHSLARITWFLLIYAFRLLLQLKHNTTLQQSTALQRANITLLIIMYILLSAVFSFCTLILKSKMINFF